LPDQLLDHLMGALLELRLMDAAPSIADHHALDIKS
jgi:hypothetical protein